MPDILYIMKIRGKVKIPDYVQIRDERFTLIAYFRTDRPERALSKCGLEARTAQLMEIIWEIPYGKIKKVELS